MHRTWFAVFFLLLTFLFPSAFSFGGEDKAVSKDEIVEKGIRVKFSIEPVGGRSAGVREGEYAEVKFTITEASSGSPVTSLRPAAWIDRVKDAAEEGGAGEACRNRIKSYLRGSLAVRPDADLNTYYILAMNNDATISVIDPIVGVTGITQLYAMAMLPKPGEDWTFGPDERRLYVTMPRASQVAVVDTGDFKVIANIDAGDNPVRIALQPDGKYLWVGNDSPDAPASGVTVIDAAALETVVKIRTGAGPHEIAFSPDSLFAFVANRDEGSVSVIDVQKLKKIKDIRTADRPASLAVSGLSKAAYVVHEDGAVIVLDTATFEVIRRIDTKPGLNLIRFAPGDRWGFATNAREGLVHLLDSSNNTISSTVVTGKGPDQIAFTSTFAYIRSKESTELTLVKLDSLGKETGAVVRRLIIGKEPPGSSLHASVADAIVPTPERDTVLVANPADKFIYYYMEGMEVPMGNFQGYGRVPRAVRVVDRGLRETAKGVYTTKVMLPDSGKFQAALLLDAPRVFNCFEFDAKANLYRAAKKSADPKLKLLNGEATLKVGEPFTLRFALSGQPGAGNEGLRDVVVQATLMPGLWQERFIARYTGDGIYEVDIKVPKPGLYYIFFSSRTLKAEFSQLPYFVLQAL